MKKLLFIDVRKAHLNPECHEDVYIELPQEAGAASGMCGKLNHWLYGFRPAAQAWENEYAKKLEEAGFARGNGSPVVFWNQSVTYHAWCTATISPSVAFTRT